MEDENKITPGKYTILQRQGYTKLYKVKENGTVMIKHLTVETQNAVNAKFFDLFQMKPKGNSRKLCKLERVNSVDDDIKHTGGSGNDNRNIIDDGTSQTLTKEQIEELQDGSKSSVEIVNQLIANSKTFSSKTGYSQEKYKSKKQKKYYEYIYFRKPTIRILAQMFYRQDPTKVLGIRTDDLSQILAYANIQTNGKYILFDSGTSGLMTAAILNAIGAKTSGKLIHMHPGNECQKVAVQAMEFPEEQLSRCINVNIYSVLRCFYQKSEENKLKRKLPLEDEEVEQKKIKLDDVEGVVATEEVEVSSNIEVSNGKKTPGWQIENAKACEILREGVDGIIIVAKEHPASIVKELTQFLNVSRNLVVFHLLREPLQDIYIDLKKSLEFINIKVSNNFVRNYQVLPDRTHPLVNMNSGGHILHGQKVQS